jgi:hypothetical protein
MAEVKHVAVKRRAVPTVDRWLLDVESEDSSEREFDPYGGRFSSDPTDLDSDESEFDRVGGHGLFGF